MKRDSEWQKKVDRLRRAAGWERAQWFAKLHYGHAQSLVRLERRRLGRMPSGRGMAAACQHLQPSVHPGFVAILAAIETLKSTEAPA